MIEPRAGEAGERVNNSHHVGIYHFTIYHFTIYHLFICVDNNERVDGVMVHRFTGFHYLYLLFSDWWT